MHFASCFLHFDPCLSTWNPPTQVGVPSVQRVLQEKGKQEELRIYVEPRLRCRKLLPFAEEEAKVGGRVILDKDEDCYG